MRSYNPLRLLKMATPADGYSDEVLLYAKSDGSIYKKVGSTETRVDVAANTPQYRSRSNTAAQSVATSTWSALVGNQEAEAAQGGITVGANVFTVSLAGIYVISGGCQWAANVNGVRRMCVNVDGNIISATEADPSDGTQLYQQICATVYLPASAVISVMLYQNTGAALSTVANAYNNRQTIARIG